MALLPLPEENPIQALSSGAGNEVGAAVAQHSINQQLPSSSAPASLPTQEFVLEGLQEWKWLTSRLQHYVHMFSSTLTEIIDDKHGVSSNAYHLEACTVQHRSNMAQAPDKLPMAEEVAIVAPV